MAVAGLAREEVFQAGGGDLGPDGDRAGSSEVPGEIAEDPQPGVQVMSLISRRPAGRRVF